MEPGTRLVVQMIGVAAGCIVGLATHDYVHEALHCVGPWIDGQDCTISPNGCPGQPYTTACTHAHGATPHWLVVPAAVLVAYSIAILSLALLLLGFWREAGTVSDR